MNTTTMIEIGSRQIQDSTTVKQLPLGTYAVTRDGRGFRYVQNGAVLLVEGNAIQTAAQKTNYQNLTPVAAAIGATSFTTTPGATSCTANQFAEGWVQVDTTPDLGAMYQIASHPSNAGSVATAWTLYSDEYLRTAWTSSTRIGIIENTYANIIQSPVTTLTGAVVGACVWPIPASTSTVFQYGWVQTHGPANMLIAGTPAVGQSASCPTTSAGAVAINSGTLQIIGTMMVTGQAGLCQLVFLTID